MHFVSLEVPFAQVWTCLSVSMFTYRGAKEHAYQKNKHPPFPRGMRLGGSDYLQRTRLWKPGPASLAEFSVWPSTQLNALSSPDVLTRMSESGAVRTRRLASILSHGVVVHTDFSGRRCVEAVLLLQEAALRQAGVQLPARVWKFWRVSEIDKYCLESAINCRVAAPEHVFTNILDRLPADGRSQVHMCNSRKRKLSCDDTTSTTNAFEKYKGLQTYLDDQSERMFSWSSRSCTCLRHPGKQCAVSSRDSLEEVPDKRPITLCVAGSMCVAWSRFGKRLGLADETAQSWYVWSEEVAELGYDICILENSSEFPVSLFADKLQRQHVVVSLLAGPETLGWPVQRLRLFAAAINLERLVWCGPLEPETILEDFLAIFGARTVVNGDVFVGSDSPQHRRAYYEHRCASRGMYPRSDVELTIDHALSKGELENMRGYAQLREGHERFRGSTIADLSQSHSSRPRMHQWMPTLARSSRLCSLGPPHQLLTPNEIDFAHGWPRLPLESGSEYFNCLQSFGCVNSAEAFHAFSSMAGNGMHLAAISAWLSYVFSHTAVRAEHSQMAPAVGPPHDTNDTDEA